MSDAPVTLAPGTRVGEYQITGTLGKGGMGTVYAGVHPVIGKKVAIKVLNPDVAQSPEVIARFVQEARAVNQIGHRNIIDIFAFGDLPGGGGHYFVMERLEGESLQSRLEREGRMPASEVLAVLEQIADAIDRAHAVGITHRDLKPDNIFLVPDRREPLVKVLDFGIAKLTDGAVVGKTRTGVPMGTPLFMSPEQWRGQDVDHRTDVYALGVMAWHMLTGRYPFATDSFHNLMYMHLEEPPPPPSRAGAPRWTDAPILTALAKDKARRPGSAAAFCAALRAAMQGGSTEAFEETVPPVATATVPPRSAILAEPVLQSKPGDYFAAPGATLPPPRRRRSLWLAGGALAATGAVAAAVVALGGGSGPKPASIDQRPAEERAVATPADAAPAPLPDAAPASPPVVAQPPDAAPPPAAKDRGKKPRKPEARPTPPPPPGKDPLPKDPPPDRKDPDKVSF